MYDRIYSMLQYSLVMNNVTHSLDFMQAKKKKNLSNYKDIIDRREMKGGAFFSSLSTKWEGGPTFPSFP